MKDMLEAGILEPYMVKHWGIKLATNAAITVLRVDQVCTHTHDTQIIKNSHKEGNILCDVQLSIHAHQRFLKDSIYRMDNNGGL